MKLIGEKMSALKLEIERNRPYLNPDVKNRISVSVKIGASTTGEMRQVPVYSVILIDNSGSMAGERLRYAKEAVRALLSEMGGSDAISVLSFSKKVNVVVSPSDLKQKAGILRAIETISANNVTEMHGAIKYLQNLLQSGKDPNRETRVILLSDGEPTDVKDPARYSELVSTIRAMGITFSTVGIGASDDRVLRAISDAGGGAWTNIKSLEDLSSAFIRDFNRARSGKTQTLYLYPEQGVSIIALNMFKPRPQRLEIMPMQKPGTFYSFLPSLGEDMVVTMQLEIPPGHYSEGENKIMNIGISSKEGEVDTWQSIEVDFTHNENLIGITDKRVTAETLLADVLVDGQTAIDKSNQELAAEVEEKTRMITEEFGNVLSEEEEGKTKVTQEVAKEVADGEKLSDAKRKDIQAKIRDNT